VISRVEEKASRECRGEVIKVQRNLDAKLHPMERAREVGNGVAASRAECAPVCVTTGRGDSPARLRTLACVHCCDAVLRDAVCAGGDGR
jgi:hypothetical protein